MTPVSGGQYPVPAAGAKTVFVATNVEQLEDSPVITGQYFHEFPLAPAVTPKHSRRRFRLPGGLQFAPGDFGRGLATWFARQTRSMARTITTCITCF